jgi:UDP-glucose 4-epimerase
MFKNKTLLITGGTGTFGNAVIRRFLNSDLKEIRIFSRDEKKQDDARHYYNNPKLKYCINPKLKYCIGDVRSYSSVLDVCKGVNYIFHAAALKQVPSCEFYPLEAVNTNIIGSENVLSAADREGVEKVIVLSTDKAVYPINAMGLTKAN